MSELLLKLLPVAVLGAAMTVAQVKITPESGRVHIEINGQPYADFVTTTAEALPLPADGKPTPAMKPAPDSKTPAVSSTGVTGEAMKPYFYPLRAASGTIVTRHWPMDKVSQIEPVDHQHQRGVWFGHDNVNGFDFWNNESDYKTPNRGRQKLVKLGQIKSGKDEGRIVATFDWLDMHGNKLLQENRVITIHTTPTMRIVDFDSDLTAAIKVTFGDGKDGCFGIRMAAALQEDKTIKSKGKPDVIIPGPAGVISNAEGASSEKAVWGKPSNWADYSGEIDGEKLGIAILDHPSNSRRARWHERAYGLFAANPFGLNVFTGDKSQDGSVTIQPGEKLHFKYRVIVHPGDAKSANIAKMWDEYLKEVI